MSLWSFRVAKLGVLLAVPVCMSVPFSAEAFSNNAAASDGIGQFNDAWNDPQPVFTKSVANDGPNKLGLSAPEGLLVDSDHHRLFLSDAGNHRVLVYDLENDGTLTDYTPDHVIGQPNFYSNAAAATQAGLNSPQGMAYDSAGDRLFVAQSAGQRITVYDTSAITDGENAINVLGQATFTTATAASTQAGMRTPQRLAYDAARGYLFVTHSTGNRVTVFDVNAITNGEPAINVLGQANFTTITAATTQAGMNVPVGVAFDPVTQYLYVAQSTANRVTVYDTAVLTDGENAINVLGQADFVTATAATTQAGMNVPQGIAVNTGSSLLYVSQSTGNRVTVYDIAAITDGENAVNVLGQASFTTATAANTQAGLSTPQGVFYAPYSNRLYVIQSGANRVSIFDVASITDGENAVNIIGRYDDSILVPQPVFTGTFTAHNGPNRLGFSAPVGVAVDGTHHRLFVSDVSNNRVLVYGLNANNVPTDRVPDYVIGQQNFYSNAAATTQAGLNAPQYVEYDATYDRLFVAQSTGNRVTVFDTASIVNGENAINVLGQTTFTAATAANTQASLRTPVSLAYDSAGRRLFVAQQGSHRVSVFDEHTVDGKAAVDGVGQYGDDFNAPQPVFTKSVAHDGPNKLGLNAVEDVVVDPVHHRLFVSDAGNNRVLVYVLQSDNTLADFTPDYVIGQPNFYTNTAATTQAGLNSPQGMAYDAAADRLFIAQATANRVTVYDTSSITNGENAVSVIGQANFTTATAASTQAGMRTPQRVEYDAARGYLFVSQSTGNRVTVFDVATIIDGEPAINVLGQADFVTITAATTQAGMNVPVGLAYDPTTQYLYVSQTTANRVTVYDTAVLTDGENAINVLGQADFVTATAATTQAGMNVPQGIAVNTGSSLLYVSQSTANRVSVFDIAAITDGENAVNVLGQSLFTVATAASTQAGLSAPQGAYYEPSSNLLYVTQSGNHRVSIFDVAAITNGENAASLVGQYDDDLSNPQPVFTKSAANNGPDKLGLSGPVGVTVDSVQHRLFLSDSGNNRVLVYDLNNDNSLIDRIPDNVLGQPNFYSNAAATTQAGMNVPQYLAFDAVNDRLFVPQSSANRVTVYDTASIANGENAVNVLGQANFTTATAANTQSRMRTPVGVTYDPDNSRLFVSQSGNHRVTVYDVAAITDGENAINVLGQTTFTAFAAATTQAGMNAPQDVSYSDAGLLFVAQSTANRVTVYDVSTITDGEDAINVLGQADFVTATAATTQAGMNVPQGVAINTGSSLLYVSQSTGNRVTIYDIASITDGENAVNVLGQAFFNVATALTTQAGMNGPRGVYYDSHGDKLYVVQATANRLGIYDLSLVTFSDGQPAANVLGQADFTSFAAATTQAGMNVPTGLAYDSAGQRLFVAQSTANRVTTYDVSAITNGENAVNVLGQPDFVTATAATTQAGMSAPQGLAYDASGSLLYVGSTVTRVTSYDVAAITDGENAVNVLGQATFTAAVAANTQSSLNGVRGLAFDAARRALYVVQATANRLSVFVPPVANKNYFYFLGE